MMAVYCNIRFSELVARTEMKIKGRFIIAKFYNYAIRRPEKYAITRPWNYYYDRSRIVRKPITVYIRVFCVQICMELKS